MRLLQPSIAISSEPDPVRECVSKCDKALADQDKVLNLKTQTIEAQKSVIDSQDKTITEMKKANSGLLASPWFYITIGVLVGGFVVGKAK